VKGLQNIVLVVAFSVLVACYTLVISCFAARVHNT